MTCRAKALPPRTPTFTDGRGGRDLSPALTQPPPHIQGLPWSQHDHQPDLELSRRDALKLAVGVGAAVMIPLVPADVAAAAQKAVASGKPAALKFFTVAQHRAVDALTEVIIPTDERSPGARAAKVADYLDFILNEAPVEAKKAWNDGLVALDAASAAQFSKPFADLTGEQQVAIVTEAAKDEANPTTPLATFFLQRPKAGRFTAITPARSASIGENSGPKATSSCRNSLGAITQNTCPNRIRSGWVRFGRVGSGWAGLGQVGIQFRAFVIVSRG